MYRYCAETFFLVKRLANLQRTWCVLPWLRLALGDLEIRKRTVSYLLPIIMMLFVNINNSLNRVFDREDAYVIDPLYHLLI